MKPNPFLSLGALCMVALCSTVRVDAQPLTITPSLTQCSAAGGVLTLRVAFDFAGASPAVIGLQLLLPPDWSHVATVGPNAPQVSPAPGDTGSLGWAYVEVPEKSAEFRVELRYPGGVNAEQVLRAISIWRPAPPENPKELKIVFAAP